MTGTRSVVVSRWCPAPSRVPGRDGVGVESVIGGTFVALKLLLISNWQQGRLLPLLGLARLARLAAHLLAGVANPFALVWLRWPHTPNSRCLLANQLLVDAGDG